MRRSVAPFQLQYICEEIYEIFSLKKKIGGGGRGQEGVVVNGGLGGGWLRLTRMLT